MMMMMMMMMTLVPIDTKNVRTKLLKKIWAVPGYAHAPFSSEFFTGLCSDGPYECIGQICSP